MTQLDEESVSYVLFFYTFDWIHITKMPLINSFFLL